MILLKSKCDMSNEAYKVDSINSFIEETIETIAKEDVRSTVWNYRTDEVFTNCKLFGINGGRLNCSNYSSKLTLNDNIFFKDVSDIIRVQLTFACIPKKKVFNVDALDLIINLSTFDELDILNPKTTEQNSISTMNPYLWLCFKKLGPLEDHEFFDKPEDEKESWK